MAGFSTTKAALLCGVSCFIPALAVAQAQDDTFALGEIVVESKREVQTDTAVALTVVDQEEIDDRQAGTIAELIDSVPGVTLINGTTPSGSGIVIRGFGANSTYGSNQKVAIQVDGATQGSEELYRIGTQLYTDPELFKEVSVLRGTIGSFEYGSGIVGGVVRLQTKDASDFTGGEIGFRARQALSFGSNGDALTSSTILAWQPTEDLEFLANYIWREQGEQEDGDGNAIGAPGFELPSWMIKGKYSFGQDRAHWISLMTTDTQTEERDVPYDAFAGSTIGTNMFGNADRDIQSRTIVLAYGYNPVGNDLVDVSVNLSYADQKIDSTYVEGSSPMESIPGFGDVLRALVGADHRYETTQLTVKNTARFSFAGIANELRTGVELIRKERQEANSAPGGTDDRIAVFVIDDLDFGNGFTLSPGLRYETQDIDGTEYGYADYSNSAMMGGISARYAWSNGFAVFASAAYTEGLPILDDMTNTTYMNQSEKARTYELGVSYDGQDLFGTGDAFAVKANLYRTALWDATSELSGVVDADLNGIELEAAYSMANGFYIDANANVTDYTGRNAAGEEADLASMPSDQLRLTLGKRWDRTFDLGWEAVANASIEETPGYVVHNLRGTYRPQFGALEGAEFRLSVENMFDTVYTPNLATRTAPGRNVKLTLAKTF